MRARPGDPAAGGGVVTVSAVLGVVVLIASGAAAGVLFSVALSVGPAFLAVAPDRYVEMHKLIGRRYDRVMPPTVGLWVACDIALAVAAGSTAVRGLLTGAAVLGIGVMVVSQFGNVPINRQVKRIDPGAIPPGWRDRRHQWRNFNLVRTSFAILGLVVNASAIVAVR
jgi:uncharacterized membrane protein